MRTSTKSYTVIYRTGGRARCIWKRCAPVPTWREAEEQRAEIERMGYRASIFDTDQLDRIGMPEGWEAAQDVANRIKLLCHECGDRTGDPDESHCPQCGSKDVGQIDTKTGERI